MVRLITDLIIRLSTDLKLEQKNEAAFRMHNMQDGTFLLKKVSP